AVANVDKGSKQKQIGSGIGTKFSMGVLGALALLFIVGFWFVGQGFGLILPLVGLVLVASLFASNFGANRSFQRMEAKEKELESRAQALGERVSQQAEIINRNDRLRQFLPAQLVKSIVQEDAKAEVGFLRVKVSVVVATVEEFFSHVTKSKLEPEDQARILNQFFDAVTQVAQRFGATLDGLSGTKVTLFVGAPKSKGEKEDAILAVRVALGIVRLVEEMLLEWTTLGANRLRILPKVGVHSGYAVVGNFGSEFRLQYTIVGDGLNLANLAARATPLSGVTVTHPTRVFCRDSFSFQSAGDIEALGQEKPLQVYQVKTLN
ncbi:MAG: adenylate/guanylate cyclase domain-containing protein, partial [Pseudomonadota bacterium]